MAEPPRKLAELWEIDGDYHLRVEVSAFQRELGARDSASAEEVAAFEVIEALRQIVAQSDGGQIRQEVDVPRE